MQQLNINDSTIEKSKMALVNLLNQKRTRKETKAKEALKQHLSRRKETVNAVASKAKDVVRKVKEDRTKIKDAIKAKQKEQRKRLDELRKDLKSFSEKLGDIPVVTRVSALPMPGAAECKAECKSNVISNNPLINMVYLLKNFALELQFKQQGGWLYYDFSPEQCNILNYLEIKKTALTFTNANRFSELEDEGALQRFTKVIYDKPNIDDNISFTTIEILASSNNGNQRTLTTTHYMTFYYLNKRYLVRSDSENFFSMKIESIPDKWKSLSPQDAFTLDLLGTVNSEQQLLKDGLLNEKFFTLNPSSKPFIIETTSKNVKVTSNYDSTLLSFVYSATGNPHLSFEFSVDYSNFHNNHINTSQTDPNIAIGKELIPLIYTFKSLDNWPLYLVRIKLFAKKFFNNDDDFDKTSLIQMLVIANKTMRPLFTSIDRFRKNALKVFNFFENSEKLGKQDMQNYLKALLNYRKAALSITSWGPLIDVLIGNLPLDGDPYLKGYIGWELTLLNKWAKIPLLTEETEELESLIVTIIDETFKGSLNYEESILRLESIGQKFLTVKQKISNIISILPLDTITPKIQMNPEAFSMNMNIDTNQLVSELKENYEDLLAEIINQLHTNVSSLFNIIYGSNSSKLSELRDRITQLNQEELVTLNRAQVIEKIGNYIKATKPGSLDEFIQYMAKVFFLAAFLPGDDNTIKALHKHFVYLMKIKPPIAKLVKKEFEDTRSTFKKDISELKIIIDPIQDPEIYDSEISRDYLEHLKDEE